MKNFFLVTLIIIGANSTIAFATETQNLKQVRITFSDDDSKIKTPETAEDQRAAAVVTEHTPSSKALDAAIEDVF